MGFDLNLAHMSISELLEKAAENNEIIYVRSRQRCIGKTTSLIQFARENNCSVLMNRIAYDYQKRNPDVRIISYTDEVALDGLTNIVCDESVPFGVVKRLRQLGQLLTGFVLKDASDQAPEQNTDDQGELRVEQKPSLLTKAIHENVSNIVDKELPELEKDLKSAKKKVSVIEKRIDERRELVDEAIKKFGHPIPPSPFELLHS
ncbi:hypothetical protein [Bacillus atrophaeus]|uniref:hypothetical protein n=1 Tax=Bacillus atrophaeus TaxID=1452 RepID=UPI0022801009|nr:hypothetical protein [Bacillus atrophaeus]MCY8517926.1 hypothetical protein [Bacillus atrophaeus]